MNILIILGNKLLKGGKMDDILLNRLKKSIDIYEKKKYNFIIVSGGKVQKDSDYSESYIMKKFLLKNNIPPNIIIEEDQSIDTIQNSFKCLNIINKIENINQINILSSEFHIERVKAIFNKNYKNYKLKYIQSNNGIYGETLHR
jgi:vancomycin permeability regulator SanA